MLINKYFSLKNRPVALRLVLFLDLEAEEIGLIGNERPDVEESSSVADQRMIDGELQYF